MSIIIRERVLKNKEISLYLDMSYNGERAYRWLNIRLSPGSRKAVKDRNKELRSYAEQIRAKLENEMLSSEYGINITSPKKLNLLPYFTDLAESTGKSKDIYLASVRQLKAFAKRSSLFPSDVTERFLEEFYEHLIAKYNGETPHTYFKKMKVLLAKATKDRLFHTNPASDIRGKRFSSTQKETLTEADFQKLVAAECRNEAVKYAFLFCCLTGLRFSDVVQLEWNNIAGDKISLVQQKTKKKVTQILHPDATHILSKMPKTGSRIFPLPTHRGCLKILADWVKKAGIEKKITWHCARHTFGTILQNTGADLLTTSKLLGHSSIVPTQRYLRESDTLKKEAVLKLPQLFTNKTK